MRYLKYALVLCMHETLIVAIPALLSIEPDRFLTSRDLSALVAILALITAYRALLNAPPLALAIWALRPYVRALPRIGVSAVNASIYVVVLAVLLWLGDNIDELEDTPALFMWFAGACLLSPLLPWLRPPADADTSPS